MGGEPGARRRKMLMAYTITKKLHYVFGEHDFRLDLPCFGDIKLADDCTQRPIDVRTSIKGEQVVAGNPHSATAP